MRSGKTRRSKDEDLNLSYQNWVKDILVRLRKGGISEKGGVKGKDGGRGTKRKTGRGRRGRMGGGGVGRKQQLMTVRLPSPNELQLLCKHKHTPPLWRS